MAYRFAGFFARPQIESPAILPEGAVWRPISAPFVGVGVRLSELIGKLPTPVEVDQLRNSVGLGHASEWIYLMYDCWAGRVDSVYGLGVVTGQGFGPREESNVEKAKDAYVELMGEFGVTVDDSLGFPPFCRGFWGTV